MIVKLPKTMIFAIALMSMATTASANWALNNAESSIDYISIKKSKVAELNTFKTLSGRIDSNGQAQVDIDLSSVETNVDIRNERMKSILFKVATFAKANISTKVDTAKLNNMKVGESFVSKEKMTISMHGQKVDVDVEMRTTKLAGNKILASTVKPLIINAADFAYVEGIEKLREIAKLPSISLAVPVTVSLVFAK